MSRRIVSVSGDSSDRSMRGVAASAPTVHGKHLDTGRRLADTGSPRRALIAASVGFSIVVLDTTVVNVALPAMGRDLGVGMAGLQWVVDGYAIAFAALLLSTGTLSDRFGASRTLGAGLVVFGAASLACAAAPVAAVLLASRVVQGVGAALVLPASLALVRERYPDPARRTQAVALWTAAGGAAVAAGPLVGGVLTTTFGWRAIFLVNLPVLAVGLIAQRRIVSPLRRETALDVPGQVAGIAAIGALSYAVIEIGANGPTAAGGLVAGAVFLASSASFLLVELRARAPMVPLSLFRSPSLSATIVIGLVLNLAFYGEVFVLSLYFQQAQHRTALAAGLAFVPMTLLAPAANITAGRLIRRYGARATLIGGQLVLAVGLAGLAVGSGHATAMELWMIPTGIGSGLSTPPLATTLLMSVPAERAGLASGLLNSARQLGGALGVAVFGAILGQDLVRGSGVAALTGSIAVLAAVVVTFLCLRESRRR